MYLLLNPPPSTLTISQGQKLELTGVRVYSIEGETLSREEEKKLVYGNERGRH